MLKKFTIKEVFEEGLNDPDNFPAFWEGRRIEHFWNVDECGGVMPNPKGTLIAWNGDDGWLEVETLRNTDSILVDVDDSDDWSPFDSAI